MKFYDCRTAPSPRRARIFIAEKGIAVETVEVDLAAGEQFSDAFRRLNPRCTVPVLELDDGTAIGENAGIAAYLEAVCPHPPLLGRDPRDKALVAAWNARCEAEGLHAVAECFRNRARGLRDRALTGGRAYPQIPELVERGRLRTLEFFDTLERRLADAPYVAGEHFSVADITALCAVDFAAWIKLEPGDDRPHLRRWHAAVTARPSVQ